MELVTQSDESFCLAEPTCYWALGRVLDADGGSLRLSAMERLSSPYRRER
jgi:hypothetical protein